MSIKVKHEGNATAAAFASAEGGKGKRAREEAAPMASVMQQAANAGGQQLRGATAQVTSPGRATAPTTHAPTISAPNPPLLRNNLGAMSNNFGATHSGVGMGVNTQKSAGIGASQRGGFENRGMTAQQKMAAMTEQDILDEKLRRMRLENNALQANSEVIEGNERFGEHSPDAQWDTGRGVWVRAKRPGEDEQNMAMLKSDLDIQRMHAQAANQHIANGRSPDMSDDDYARWIQMGGPQGRATWDYAPEDRAAIDDAKREISQKRRDGVISDVEAQAALAQLGERTSGMAKVVQPRFTAPNTIEIGGKTYFDNGGKWEAVKGEMTDSEKSAANFTDKLYLQNAKSGEEGLTDEQMQDIIARRNKAQGVDYRGDAIIPQINSQTLVNPGLRPPTSSAQVAQVPSQSSSQSADPLAKFSKYKDAPTGGGDAGNSDDSSDDEEKDN